MCRIKEPIKIKLDLGYLIIEEKGTVGEYPGINILYDVDGNPDEAVLCACVEEDSPTRRLLVETYSSSEDDPVLVYDFFNDEEVF